jgi:hypothetical protein
VTVESGELEQLGVMSERVLEFAIHPAGDQVAYATYVQEDQIWVMGNLNEVLERHE